MGYFNPVSPTYASSYRDFDAPLMRQLRLEAYGEDIGQHSWVTAAELREDLGRLGLDPSSRLLDLGCGPCGPLTFLVAAAGCRGTGIDLEPLAIAAGRRRATEMGIADSITTIVADLSEPLPLPNASLDAAFNAAFNAAISLDVVLHVRNRLAFYREAARVLRPGARFLVTDAGVVTGAISNDEVTDRAGGGPIELVPVGWNEAQLEAAGFRVIETTNRTASVATHAAGRLGAMLAHRAELVELWGEDQLAEQGRYLAAVAALASRGALSRIGYLAERADPR